jgi:selenocysteine-specific elongation factor
MARLIGTAGHVDHGKTTLIQALTGIDADRLPEEKARGMTIDIGFAYADLPDVGRVSIVDVPGHERFLTNMLVGALGIDVALLVVAADEGVMPQTREHFLILDLLPVQKLVVAMTRSDLADAETRGIVRAEVEELLQSTRFAGAPICEVSALTGEGVDRLRAELAEALKSPEEPRSGPWYLPVDRVFTVKGHGCVVTGTLAQGSVKAGARAFLEPGHVEVRVRSVQSHGEAADSGERGRRTALNLGGVKTEDIRRGMAVGEPGALFETRILDARIRWTVQAKHGMRVRASIGAAEVIGKLFLNEAESDLAQLRLEEPVACALGQPIIVRRYSPPDVLGGGRIVVPQASPRRKSEAASLAAAQEDPEVAIIQILEGQEDGVLTEEVCRRLGKSPQALGGVFEKLRSEKRALGYAGLWFEPTAFLSAAQRFMKSLKELHEQKPMQALQPREAAVRRAGLKWSGKPLDRILATLATAGKLRVEGTGVRLPSFKIALTERQRSFLDRVVAALDAAGVNPPGSKDLAAVLHVPYQAVEEILKLGVEAGEIARVAEGVFFTPAQLEKLCGKVRELGSKGLFTAADFRDAVGTSRKYAIPLLEHFDAIRLTVRVGDKRALVKTDAT